MPRISYILIYSLLFSLFNSQTAFQPCDGWKLNSKEVFSAALAASTIGFIGSSCENDHFISFQLIFNFTLLSQLPLLFHDFTNRSP